MDKRFLHIVDLSILSTQFFLSLLIGSRTFTFSHDGETFWLLLGISELPVSLLSHFCGTMIKKNKSDLNTSAVMAREGIR